MKNNRKNTELPAVIDIGNASVKVLVADLLAEDKSPVLRGVGEAAVGGVSEGKIVDIGKVAEALKQALKEAEAMSERKVGRAVAAISGDHVHSRTEGGSAVISDNEVTTADVSRVREMACAAVADSSLRVLDALERDYEIDAQSGIHKPLGMSGKRLTGRMNLVVAGRQFLENMEKCIVQAGVQPMADFVFSGLAAAKAVLTDDEKKLGVCLVDIGAGTTEMLVYAGGVYGEMRVSPIAANHIHYDVAHTHHASVKDAERVKREIGVHPVSDDSVVLLSDAGGGGDNKIGKAVVRDTISCRVDEILDEIGSFMAASERINQLKLSAGIVFVGDGALLPGLAEMTKQKLKINARIGLPRYRGEKHEYVASPRFAVAVGLLPTAIAAVRRNKVAGWKGFAAELRKFFLGGD